MDQIFRVSADHSIPKYGCTNAEARVGRNSFNGKFYATMSGYGCSKDYATPELAIRSMLQDHACTNIRIVKGEG